MKMTQIQQVPTVAGEVFVFEPDPASRAALAGAPATGEHPSYLQEAHLKLRLAMQGIGKADASWLGTAADIEGDLDVEAAAAAITTWVRRHPVLHGYFRPRAEVASAALPATDDDFIRFAVPAADLTFTARSVGRFDTGDEVNAFLLDYLTTHCDPLSGDLGYGFAAVRGEQVSTMFFATDHCYSDGFSTMVAVWELNAHYEAQLAGTPAQVPPVDDYTAFAQQELLSAREMGIDHPGVKYWVDYAFDGGGAQEGFPLDLGVPAGEKPWLVPVETHLLSAAECEELEKVAKDEGSTFPATLYAAYALTARDLAGASAYRCFNPMATRHTQEQFLAMGWYINVVPLHIPLEAGDDLWSVSRRVRQIFRDIRPAYDVPALRVMELAKEVFGFEADSTERPSIVSYLDGRLLPGHERWIAQRAHAMFGGGHDNDVNVWLNRLDEELVAVCSVPDIPTATSAVNRYLDHAAGLLRGAIT